MTNSFSTVFIDGTTQPDFDYGLKYSGTIDADDVTDGKALSLDTTVANTVKLAANDDLIIGRLFQLEDRVVEGIQMATFRTKGGLRFPKNESETIALGDTIIGAGDGLVKSAGSADSSNRVIYVGTDYVVALLT